jgi:predicted TIM-barrel fold metal-dependent hydrolase
MKDTSAIPNNTITTQPGFSSSLSLAKSGKLFIKISGFYRSAKLTTGGYDDLEPLVKAFVAEVLDQLMWASDWPHTGSDANRTEETKYTPDPFREVDDTAVFKSIREWVGPEVWWKMTVETPGRVYK